MTYLSKLFRSIEKGTVEQSKPAAAAGRIKAIDQFRGFSIILMVVFNFGATINTIPDWLKHVPDIGLNFPDLGSPVFIFAIGLTFGLSFRRRVEKFGVSATYGHFIRRYLAILGLGAVFSAGGSFLGLNPHGMDWGVLQAIGGAGLVTLIVIFFPTGVRLAIGFGILAAYQILLDTFWLAPVLGSPHGGFAGALSWSAVLILSTVFGDLYQNTARRKYFPWVSLVFLVAGFALGVIVPISKNRVSASYDLITIGFSAMVFSVFYLTNFDLPYFEAWGKNPFLLYVLSLMLTGIFVLPDIPAWHAEAPLWLAGLQAAALVLILGSLAVVWQKRGFRFSM